MKIHEVMTVNPIWCLPLDTSIQAAHIMRELNVGTVPVVKSSTNHRLVEVVTDRDLCLGVVALNQHPEAVPVQLCMTTNMIACQPDEDIQRAADLMEEHQIRRIPVVDQDGILQVIVSTADICQRANLSSDTTHHLLKKVTKPTDHASKSRATRPHKALSAVESVLPVRVVDFTVYPPSVLSAWAGSLCMGMVWRYLMASIPTVAGVLSCACWLGLGLSNTALAIENSLATDEIQTKQNAVRKGSLPGLFGQGTDTRRDIHILKGEVLGFEDDHYVVKGSDGRRMSLHVDETTKMTKTFAPGEWIEAKVIQYNDRHYALSIK